jgi:hypothetical protein
MCCNLLPEALDEANKRADDLALRLRHVEATHDEEVADLRKRLQAAEHALSEQTSRQIAREEAVIERLETQNRRFVSKFLATVFPILSMKFLHMLINPDCVSAGKMGEDFVLHESEEDRLLDTLSILELHGNLARTGISSARDAFTRLFPYFFPKQQQPETFSELARRFLPEEDLMLAARQESLKIGVEGTIALVARSQQDVDWARAGEAKGLRREKWVSLVKAAKPHSKKILAFLGYKPATPSSSARPEVK